MGSAASTISAEQFQSVKSLYESKKAEGLSDEELFNQIKAVLDHSATKEEVQPTVSIQEDASHVKHRKPEDSAAPIEQHVLPPKSPRSEDAPVLVSVDAHPEPPVELVVA